MRDNQDPTEAIQRKALTFPDVQTGKSCNQNAFKVGKGTFLFIGPGPKGIGFKAMFKLKDSIPQVRELAEQHPGKFQAGSTGWVTARFTAEEPLSEHLWEAWLSESYDVTLGAAR